MKKLQSLLRVSAALLMLIVTIGCQLETSKEAQSSDESITLDANRGGFQTRDKYENDDTRSDAKRISRSNKFQDHNFYDDTSDWVKFDAKKGETYLIETEVKGNADTILYVYDSKYSSGYKARNNNCNKDVDLSSRIVYKVRKTSTHYVRIRSDNGKGTNRSYRVRVSRIKVIQSDKLGYGRNWNMYTQKGGRAVFRRGTSRGHQIYMHHPGESRDSVSFYNCDYDLDDGDYEFILDVSKRKDYYLKARVLVDENRGNYKTYARQWVEVSTNPQRIKLDVEIDKDTNYGQLSVNVGGGGDYNNYVYIKNTLFIQHL